MDVVCRDDEKKGIGVAGSFFRDFKNSLSAGISRLFGMFYLLYISTLGDFLGVYFFKPVEGRI